jgi:hypothetical protein
MLALLNLKLSYRNMNCLRQDWLGPSHRDRTMTPSRLRETWRMTGTMTMGSSIGRSLNYKAATKSNLSKRKLNKTKMLWGRPSEGVKTTSECNIGWCVDRRSVRVEVTIVVSNKQCLFLRLFSLKDGDTVATAARWLVAEFEYFILKRYRVVLHLFRPGRVREIVHIQS